MGPKNKGSVTRRAEFGRTPISDIFRGHLRSRVQRAGDQSTDNVQPFFTLQLDVEVSEDPKL
jgi:ubiquitin carboxyl-terminal hydrolase 10